MPVFALCTCESNDLISFVVDRDSDGEPVSVTECASCGDVLDFTG